MTRLRSVGWLAGGIVMTAISAVYAAAPTAQTYMPVVPTKPFEEVLKQDTADKPKVMADQKALLEKRYDLGDKP